MAQAEHACAVGFEEGGDCGSCSSLFSCRVYECVKYVIDCIQIKIKIKIDTVEEKLSDIVV